MRWKLIFPWVEMEDGGNEKLYCRECRSAKLKNVFAVGKNRSSGGWKKEYLQRHAVSNDHVKYASEAYRKTQLPVSIRTSERETLGLIRNIHFLVKNSISLNKALPLHSFVDDQMEFYLNKPRSYESRLSVASDTDEFSLTEFCSPISHIVVTAHGNLFTH